MRNLFLSGTILIFAATPALAGDKDKSEKSDEQRVEEFIENMPDMNVIAALLMSGADTLERAKTGEDNCENVQEGYKTLIKSALSEEPEATPLPVNDYNAEFAAVLREAVKEDAED